MKTVIASLSAMLLACLITGCATPTTTYLNGAHTVEYRVTTTGPVTGAVMALVNSATDSSSTDLITDATFPFDTIYYLDFSGKGAIFAASLSASVSGATSATIAIYVDGKLVKTATGSATSALVVTAATSLQ